MKHIWKSLDSLQSDSLRNILETNIWLRNKGCSQNIKDHIKRANWKCLSLTILAFSFTLLMSPRASKAELRAAMIFGFIEGVVRIWKIKDHIYEIIANDLQRVAANFDVQKLMFVSQFFQFRPKRLKDKRWRLRSRRRCRSALHWAVSRRRFPVRATRDRPTRRRTPGCNGGITE